MSTTRRDFLNKAGMGIAAASLSPFISDAFGMPLNSDKSENPLIINTIITDPSNNKERYRPPFKIGMGGVALGNGFKETSDEQALQMMQGAWEQELDILTLRHGMA